MIALIDWILSLFRDEDAARAFVTAPEQAMRDAGLAGISAAQLSSVAATAVPGLVLGGGDPIAGLQRVVANQYGIAPAFSPQPSFDPVWAPAPTYAPQATFAPENTYAPENTFAPQTTTDLASHNDTALFSPPQAAGANAQQGGVNIGFGDITFGAKTTTTATEGSVVVGRDAGGDIVSGDGALLGSANSVTNGGIRADHGSNVATAEGAAIRDSGTTTTAGGDAGVHLGAATVTTTTTEVTATTITDNSDLSSHSMLDAGYDTTLVNSDIDNSLDLALASGNQLGSQLFGF